MLSKTAISCLGRVGVSSWHRLQCRFSRTSTTPHTEVVREVLSLQLESGHAVQACVTFTQLNSSGGTQAAQAAWQALQPVLKGAKPTFVVVQSSANHQTASAATRLVHAQLKALSGSSKVIPSVVGFTTRPWTPAANTMAAAKLTDRLWKLQRHLRITAVALQDIESASFHAVSESFPVIPKLQEALTSRPPHVILLPHPSFDFEKLSSLIERLESGFQDVEVLGVVPLPPLPDQDLPTAKKQLESFRSEAGVILAEAIAADDLAAPLAVAAAEAENLTLDQLEGATPEEAVSTGQEEAAVFREDTSFMQGVVGLTLMPSTSTTRVPDADLAALACLVFGSDKLYGFFLSNKLKQHVYVPQDQQSTLAPPSQGDTSTTPLLTQADLAHFTTKPKLTTPSPSQSPLSDASSPSVTTASSLAFNNQDLAQSPQPDSPDAPAASLVDAQTAAVQVGTSLAVSADSPHQMTEDQTIAQQQALAHAEAKVQVQAQAQGTSPAPDWQSAPTDADPVSTFGTITAAGSQQALSPVSQLSGDQVLKSQDWQAASVVPEGLVLQPVAGEIGARLLQTPTQLPVFAMDSVLWPNQIMMLR
ncbi:TPA: hypothetical protein ACH3X1_004768 [Trebouxia sp. C0004]